VTAPETVVDAIRRARDPDREWPDRVLAAGAAVITIPEAVFWSVVIAMSGALAGLVRLVYRNSQRIEELERSKVDKANHIQEASDCRASLMQCITDLRLEVVAMGGTVDSIAREQGITPHPRPSNGGSKH